MNTKLFNAACALALNLGLLGSCTKYRPSQMQYDKVKATAIARKACENEYGPARHADQVAVLSVDFNQDNGHWQVQHVRGSWSKNALPANDVEIAESCIVVVDGVSGTVLNVRQF